MTSFTINEIENREEKLQKILPCNYILYEIMINIHMYLIHGIFMNFRSTLLQMKIFQLQITIYFEIL